MVPEEVHAAGEGAGEGDDAAEDFGESEVGVGGGEDDVGVEDDFESSAWCNCK